MRYNTKLEKQKKLAAKGKRGPLSSVEERLLGRNLMGLVDYPCMCLVQGTDECPGPENCPKATRYDVCLVEKILKTKDAYVLDTDGVGTYVVPKSEIEGFERLPISEPSKTLKEQIDALETGLEDPKICFCQMWYNPARS